MRAPGPLRVYPSFRVEDDAYRAACVLATDAIWVPPGPQRSECDDAASLGGATVQDQIVRRMWGTSCALVLIGSNSADDHWVNFEIQKAWCAGKGVFGVYVHNIEDASGRRVPKGANPFAGFALSRGVRNLATVVNAYDPPCAGTTDVCGYIERNLAGWVAEACAVRAGFSR